MKHRLAIACLVLLALAAVPSGAFAQEDAQQMPPMGPPEQMKQCNALVGDWDVDAQMKMDMNSEEWTPSKGTATYRMILDGSALEMTYESPMMSMPFKGVGIMTYDRETDQWQMTWTDNMTARTSLYTGTRDGDRMVMSGEDKFGGMTYQSRITTYNEKPDSFDWMMENSMDGGKTWITTGKSTYTRRK